MKRIIATIGFGMLLASACIAAAPQRAEIVSPAPRADQPCSAERLNPVSYDIDVRAVVTAPHKTKVLKVWVPVPPSDETQELLESSFNTFPMSVQPQFATEPVYGNRFAYFEFENPQGAQIIQHTFKIKVWELRWNIKPEQVEIVTDWPPAFDPYLRAESQAVVVDHRFKSLADEIAPTRAGAAHDFQSVLAWVNANLTYDHVQCSLRASAEFALENRRGHCSDYHGLCASLGRAMGYPTRVTYGINPFPKSSPSHCKVEAFVPPYGWVSFDASETQKLISRIQNDPTLSPTEQAQLVGAATRRLMSGFRDNTWFLQTRGTDYDLAPPASRRVPVVRTIYAEADGVPLIDPDPSNKDQREFGWMTAHHYVPDRPVIDPFQDLASLRN